MPYITERLNRWAPWLAIGGGLLWILYAILAMLEPMGAITAFTNDQGQTLIINPAALRTAGSAGGAALALLGAALVGTARRYHLPNNEPDRFSSAVPSRFGVAMGWVGALAGLLSVVSALLLLLPTHSAMQLLGAVLVPFGTLLVAVEANGSERACPIAAPLFLAGTLGMLALLVQAMIPLFAWMLPVYAALAMAVYGFVWVRFGSLLARQVPSL